MPLARAIPTQRLHAIQARIADHLIRGPCNGRLDFRRAGQGALVTPGTVITNVEDISKIKLDFAIPGQACLRQEKKNGSRSSRFYRPDQRLKIVNQAGVDEAAVEATRCPLAVLVADTSSSIGVFVRGFVGDVVGADHQ